MLPVAGLAPKKKNHGLIPENVGMASLGAWYQKTARMRARGNQLGSSILRISSPHALRARLPLLDQHGNGFESNRYAVTVTGGGTGWGRSRLIDKTPFPATLGDGVSVVRN
ncbi:hypothetical protein [Candidatus Igneacidithiobacillus taiwanensis]|uniref:hypothetical protein n=1 Tax=Candidatus Igneacidithiobacillus taiwanensis TaxID=1945924 RepID=UPI00289A89EF|nr:hypothetical protein [Candidatus Igneacidithiobacillus taiwanensis]